MTPRVLPPDLEVWLVSYVRATITAEGHDVEVDAKEPDELSTPLEVPLIVVRDDSGSKSSAVSFSRQVGISVLAGTRQNDRVARELARLVYAIVTDSEIALAPGSPIAAVNLSDCNGPYAVDDDHDVARRYLTAGYDVVGTW